MLAVSAWQLRRGGDTEGFTALGQARRGRAHPRRHPRRSVVGSELGVIEDKYQPMKIAASEAQWDDVPALLVLGVPDRRRQPRRDPTKIIEIPHLLSVLATGTWNGEVQGSTSCNAQYRQQYGPGNYVPNVFIQYWSMRVMAYAGSLVALLAPVGCCG